MSSASVSSEIYSTSSITYWKRNTCSSSTRISRYSNQEENAETNVEKHSENHNQKTSWSWTQQVPYEQKTENKNNKKKKNKSSHSKETSSTEKSLHFFHKSTK